jgi:hypothetical protein
MPQDSWQTLDARRRTAGRIFRGALINGALTVVWLFLTVTGRTSIFFKSYEVDLAALGRVAAGIGIFYILWGFIWYGVKSLLLRRWAGARSARAVAGTRGRPLDFQHGAGAVLTSRDR